MTCLTTLSLHGHAPLKITVLVVDLEACRIVERKPILPSVFANYIEAAILSAYKVAHKRSLAFDASYAQLNYCYYLPTDIEKAEARVQQRLFSEGVDLACAGKPIDLCWHAKQREGWHFAQELATTTIPF